MLRRCLLAGVWGVNRSDEGPGFLPGLFSCAAVTWGGWHQVSAARSLSKLSVLRIRCLTPHSRQELPMTTKDFTPLRQRMGTQSNGQRCVRRRLDSRSDSFDRADPASDRRVYEGRCRRLRLTCGQLGEGRSAWLDEERNDISLRTRPSTFSCVTPVRLPTGRFRLARGRAGPGLSQFRRRQECSWLPAVPQR